MACVVGVFVCRPLADGLTPTWRSVWGLGAKLASSSRQAVGQQGIKFVFDEFGGLAQLGEHLLCKPGVTGSIPVASTRLFVWTFWIPEDPLVLTS